MVYSSPYPSAAMRRKYLVRWGMVYSSQLSSREQFTVILTRPSTCMNTPGWAERAGTKWSVLDGLV